MSKQISDLIREHDMTLVDGAMVCKAGDWPEDTTPMPDSEGDELVSREAMEYSMQHVIGHREHLAQVVNTAQARTVVEALTETIYRLEAITPRRTLQASERRAFYDGVREALVVVRGQRESYCTCGAIEVSAMAQHLVPCPLVPSKQHDEV